MSLSLEIRNELISKVWEFRSGGTSDRDIYNGLLPHIRDVLKDDDFELETKIILAAPKPITATAVVPHSQPVPSPLQNEVVQDEAQGIGDVFDEIPSFFETIAKPLIERGWKVAPCYPHYVQDANGKFLGKTVHTTLVPRPLEMISSNPTTIHGWGLAEPDANVCVYAEQVEDGLCFVDKDGAVSLIEKYQRETNRQFPQTLLVKSSDAVDADGGYSKGHWYFHQTARTMAMKNIPESETGGLFSFRVNNMYVASIGSIHPATKKPYTVAWDNPVLPMPDDFLDWLLLHVKKGAEKPVEGNVERKKYPRGTWYPAYFKEACRLREANYTVEDAKEMTCKWVEANCEPGPFDYDKIKSCVADVYGRYKSGEGFTGLLLNQKPASNGTVAGSVLEYEGERLVHEDESVTVPAFDHSTMKGIYKQVAEELIKGTTLEPQFIYAITKVIVGAKMAGKVKFADLDVEPLAYLALCGATGSGKGEAWRRVYKILTAKDPRAMVIANPLSCAAGLKVINSADSGAGLRDVFFLAPQEQPVVCYIDEASSLGHKAGEKKNPEIVDVMGELANGTSISRTKATKGKSVAKTKDDAYLVTVLCGQNSEVWMSAFAGRTDVGWWDRLVPEFGTQQEVGDLPPIDPNIAVDLLRKINGLNYSGTMTTDLDAKARLEAYWRQQPLAVRTVARLKQQLKLDGYLEAFGQGRMNVTLADVEDSIKRFDRQMVIRRLMFGEEVPDRIGFYSARIKMLTDWMRQQLMAGQPQSKVARSWRDYEKKTNARRNNEEHIFNRAMEAHARHHLVKTYVKSVNGATYERYLPMAEDD